MKPNSGMYSTIIWATQIYNIHSPCMLTKVEQSSTDQRDKNKRAAVLSFHSVLFVFGSSQHIQLLSYATALNNVVAVPQTRWK